MGDIELDLAAECVRVSIQNPRALEMFRAYREEMDARLNRAISERDQWRYRSAVVFDTCVKIGEQVAQLEDVLVGLEAVHE